ncbi:MAG TPA: restriction endonuclease, partial [Nitrosomonas sp.]|nr:restriction endonuclease [Nitrosomonas sp.]
PDFISVQLLNQFEKFKTFRITRKSTEKEKVIESIETPEELLERSFQTIHRELVRSLLEKVKACTPSFFENLVIELLLKMGYGGNRIEAGKAIGQSGDEGIDGIINEDKLGLDIVYIQAKRWTTATIGRPEIQKFVGALHGKRAKKGVYITTSTFSPEAHQYVLVIDPKVVLIDGEQLAEYMIEYNLGVLIKDTYEIKKIDADYFIED